MIWITNLISGIFLVILGIIIKKFKMSYLIAGYNTSSKKEKEKYDEEKLVNYISKLLIISSSVLIIGAIISIMINRYEEKIIFASWIIYTIIIIIGIIYVNITDHVKKVREK